MGFKESIQIIKEQLQKCGTILDEKKYDGFIVKKLETSNTLDNGRITKQTHIAITGQQMDIFPYLRSDGYFNRFVQDNVLKKYFTLKIPVYLDRTNLMYLGNTDEVTDRVKTYTTVIRSYRQNQNEQIQLSLLSYDDEKFISFRKLLQTHCYLVILKIKEKFEYEMFGVKDGEELIDGFSDLNNKFEKLNSKTLVEVSDFIVREDQSRVENGKNILLYGVPGSGKSYIINEKYCRDESKIVRVVFHPDYMNTDFIGQILPTIDARGNITYSFTPGPFTDIMEKAYKNPLSMYYLVIEEINRGNAPAIFGEVFQLLDRAVGGESKYSVSHPMVANQMYGDPEKQIKIPSNLTILATMNTADQNVFTLDTAFQRRWAMKMIENNVDTAEHGSKTIADTSVTWKTFNKVINNCILNNNSSMMSSEDKRLGAYFVTKNELADTNPGTFAEKVIKYLWDDAFKFFKDKIFKSSYKSLEEVIKDFSNKKGDERLNIFVDTIKTELLQKKEVQGFVDKHEIIVDKDSSYE